MRMWNVDVTKMCRQHLLGEHLEMHMLKGTITKGKSVKGYLLNHLVNLGEIKQRHDIIATEMKRRKYNHKSPMKRFQEMKPPFNNLITIDIKDNEKELRKRCKRCNF